MAILSADLQGASNVFYGFGDNEQQMILGALGEFA